MDETLRKAIEYLLEQIEQGDEIVEDLLLIPEIQGASHRSALVRERVDRVPGIVTAIIPARGFYLQSPLPDLSRIHL